MRRARITRKNARYHVAAKANRNEHIFDEEQVKNTYIGVIRRAKEKYSFELINYTIMSNHIHLLIKPLADSTIAEIMRYIQGVFAMIYNRMFELEGRVWKDRFWSKIVDTFEHLTETFVYICNNPVKAKVVTYPADYRYSGITDIVRGRNDIIDIPPIDLMIAIWNEVL